MEDNKKTTRVGLRIERSLFDAASNKAKSIGLSLSSYIRMLMTVDLKDGDKGKG